MSDNNFSEYLDKNHDLLKDIVTKLKRNFEYVSVLASDCEGKEIHVTEKNISVSDSQWQERGFVVRVFKDGLYSEYSFNELDKAKTICDQIIKAVEAKDNLSRGIYVKDVNGVLYSENKIEEQYSRMDEYKDVPIPEIIKKAQKIINNSMEECEYIISTRVNVEYVKISKMFISSKKDLRQVYAWANTSYMCVLNKNDTTKYNYGAESSISLADAISKLEKKVKQINQDGVALLDAGVVVPGEYECITTPDITGLIAHEAFGHGVEMDMFVKNRALGQKYIGKKVGSELVEMHEGAIPYKDVSSYFFDDEGTLAQDTIEIQDGILKTGIADAIAACHLGIRPTGNGKRESYKRKAYTRMTTTYFAPKKSKLEDMIASIKFGYLIDTMNSGMEDPKNWGIQCIALIGKEIKDGKLTGKVVSPVIMTGYVPDLLNCISMVSKDFGISGSGACGKGYKEWVKTANGGPYLKVKVKLG